MFCSDAQGPLVPLCVHEEIPVRELRCTLQQAQSLRVPCTLFRKKKKRRKKGISRVFSYSLLFFRYKKQFIVVVAKLPADYRPDWVIDKRKPLFTGLQLLSQCIEHGMTNLRMLLSTSEALLSVQLIETKGGCCAQDLTGEACFSRFRKQKNSGSYDCTQSGSYNVFTVD